MQTFWQIFRLRILPAIGFLFRHVVPVLLFFWAIFAFVVLINLAPLAPLLAAICSVFLIIDRLGGKKRS